MSRLVSLSRNDGAATFARIAIEDGGSILVDDGELQQIFDLVAGWWEMDNGEVLGEYVGFWSSEWGHDPRIPLPTTFEFEGDLSLGEQEGGHADPSIQLGDTPDMRSLADALKTLGFDEDSQGKRVRLRVEVIG